MTVQSMGGRVVLLVGAAGLLCGCSRWNSQTADNRTSRSGDFGYGDMESRHGDMGRVGGRNVMAEDSYAPGYRTRGTGSGGMQSGTIDRRDERGWRTEDNSRADGYRVESDRAPASAGMQSGTSDADRNRAAKTYGTNERAATGTAMPSRDAGRANAAATDAATRAGTPEARILTYLHERNQEEIRLGRLAQSKGSSESVRQYGATLVRDHTALDAKVTETARKAGVSLMAPEAKPKSDAWDQDRAATPSTERQGAAEGRYEPASAKEHSKELETLSGAEFDRCFTDHFTNDHQEVIKRVEAARTSVTDPAVRALLDQTLPAMRDQERMAAALR